MALDLTHHDGSQAGTHFPEATSPKASAAAEDATTRAEGVLARARDLARSLAHTLEEPFVATTTAAKHELLLAHSLACHVVDILTSLSPETVQLSRADAE